MCSQMDTAKRLRYQYEHTMRSVPTYRIAAASASAAVSVTSCTRTPRRRAPPSSPGPRPRPRPSAGARHRRTRGGRAGAQGRAPRQNPRCTCESGYLICMEGAYGNSSHRKSEGDNSRSTEIVRKQESLVRRLCPRGQKCVIPDCIRSAHARSKPPGRDFRQTGLRP